MLKLYSYWRSSASYRVRIALHLKGLEFQTLPVHIARGGDEQHGETYRALNPQKRVPLLIDGDFKLNQSQAILDYLESRFPQPPLLPTDARLQARVRAFCMTIVADVQPLQNSGLLSYLEDVLQIEAPERQAWARYWITRGLTALDAELHDEAETPFVFGDSPTWADCILVPQVYAARRFGCDLADFARLVRVADRCMALPAFMRAHPDAQPDAQPA